MSEDVTELFDSEELSDDVDTEEQVTDSEDEQVKLEEPKKPSAEEQRNKQIEVWTERVANGEVDINDLPANLKWIKKSIEKNLELISKAPEVADLVKQEVARQKDEDKFKSLKKSLNGLTLTKDQKAQLQEEFKDLAPALGNAKALEKAMKLVGVQEEDYSKQRQGAQIPKPGNRVVEEKDLESADYHPSKSDDRVKMYEEMRAKNRMNS